MFELILSGLAVIVFTATAGEILILEKCTVCEYVDIALCGDGMHYDPIEGECMPNSNLLLEPVPDAKFKLEEVEFSVCREGLQWLPSSRECVGVQ